MGSFPQTRSFKIQTFQSFKLDTWNFQNKKKQKKE